VNVHREFRGKTFEITIVNGKSGFGVKQLRLNGEPLDGNLVPIERCRDHNVVGVELH
jgi:hypothetical protein